jgi:hypothetical protein
MSILLESDPRADDPPDFVLPLREPQLAILHWMLELEHRRVAVARRMKGRVVGYAV